MKILKLDLRAFGPFRDVVLDLAEGQEGLHIVFGPNEAGKSSSLRALRQMLYGIPVRSNDHFLVGDYASMRVGGTLRNPNGLELSFLRRKGNRDLLRTPDDSKSIDDASLENFLGGVDQGRFESLFSLNHDELVAGGRAVSSGGGLVGQLLFGGGSDLVRLSKLRKSLEEQHAELFNARATAKNPALNKALRDLSEERKAIEQASIRSDVWHEKRLEREKALTDRDQIAADLDELRRKKSKHERIAQVLADVGRRGELATSLATLSDAPRLREGFAEERRKVEDELRTAERSKTAIHEELAEIARDLQELSLPGPILAEATLIEGLQRRLGAHVKEEVEIARLRIERSTLEATAKTTLRDLGRSEGIGEVERLRLTIPQRQELRELANESRALVEACDRSAKEINRLATRQAKVAASLDALEAPADVEALNLAVKSARRDGGLDARLAEAKAEQARRKRAGDLAWKRLQPKPGSREKALEEAIPSEATILASQKAIEEAARAVDDLRRRIEESEAALAEIDRKLERLELERELPTEADLEAARARRDLDWRRIRSRWLGEGFDLEREKDLDLAARFEDGLTEVDRTSDRLRREADRVAEKAGLTADRRIAGPKLEALRNDLAAAEARSELEAKRWQALWEPLELEAATPREMLSWRLEHAKFAEAVEASREADARLDDLAAKVDSIRSGLSALLDEPGAKSETLDALIARAELAVERSKALAIKREKLQGERDEAEEHIAEARTQDGEARRRLDAWRVSWARAVSALGMAEDAGTDAVGAVLDHMTSLFDGLDKAASHQRRIEAFEADAKQLEQDVRDLLPRIDPELADLGWIPAVERLKERLDEARQSQARREDLEKRRERRKAEAKKAEASAKEAADRLDSLAREAGCEDLAELPEAEQRSQLRQAAEEEHKAIESRIRKAAAGASIDEFIAEAQAADPDALDAGLARFETEIRLKIEELEKANHRLGGIKAELDAMEETSRDARAHEAANRAQGLLAFIESKSGEYARLRLASAVLREAIERYREKNQGPILRRAGDYFVDLTLGSFSGLRTILNEKDEPLLVGQRPDGSTLGVEGMSEGTCDQLYLALKLASLEHHLDHNPPMPFVADDILVNFDDGRSLAALRVMAKLSQRTQVLFFTHHRHLIDLATSKLPANVVYVHELRGQGAPA
ncbi:AAA family ATPase [Singulisphaera sp. PoT]|uniref:ATP-binding protein n=1 Tax=Singulisphaera sp. PoT TaxID=3411797 RepID=UPI003BF48C10